MINMHDAMQQQSPYEAKISFIYIDPMQGNAMTVKSEQT